MKITHIIAETTPPPLQPVQTIFQRNGVEYFPPEQTTVKELATARDRKHAGIYFIFCDEINTGETIPFYIGISAGGAGGIGKRFKTHYNKIRGDLRKLFGREGERAATSIHMNIFPIAWRIGVAQQIFGIDQPLPLAYEKIPVPKRDPKEKQTYKVKVSYASLPKLEMKRNPDDFPVYVWNLDTVASQQIHAIEDAMIMVYQPLCNTETERRMTDNNVAKVPEELRAVIGKIMSEPIGKWAVNNVKTKDKVYDYDPETKEIKSSS